MIINQAVFFPRVNYNACFQDITLHAGAAKFFNVHGNKLVQT